MRSRNSSALGRAGDRLDAAHVRGARALVDVRWNRPTSPVAATWVPPHSSRETSSTSTIRTQSPYFSPNSAIAPSALGLVAGRLDRAHRVVAGDPAGHRPLDRRPAPRRTSRSPWVKSKRSLSGPTYEPAWRTCVAEPLAQRRVQQVGGGVVAHRRQPLARARRPPAPTRPGRARPRAARAPAPGRRRAGRRRPRARGPIGVSTRPAVGRPGRRPRGRRASPRAWPAPSRWRARRRAATVSASVVS